MAGGTFAHGCLAGADEGENVDEVVLLVYRSPHSYTREDVVEIQGHGGAACAGRVLKAVLDAGARIAEAGEFTKRAFLNGRIDLAQAEAVMDLISARSGRAAASAMEQMEGRLSSTVVTLYEELLGTAGDLGHTLDFDEGEIPEDVISGIIGRLRDCADGMGKLIATWEEGRLLREGVKVVISGLPNAGKSTLLNLLLGSNRAIVTDNPGTTRDSIEESMIIDGVPIRLVDTAGLRASDCGVEQEGVRRAESLIETADVNLRVIDGSVEMALLDESRGTWVYVVSKTDKGCLIDKNMFPEGATVAFCNLLEESSVSEIRKGLRTVINTGGHSPTPHATISGRHRSIIQYALNELNDACAVLTREGEAGAATAADHLGYALNRIGEITGRVYTTELLDNIFSRFCVGK